MTHHDQNRWKGFIIGAVGSLAGLLAMRYYWKTIAPAVRGRLGLDDTAVYPDNLDLDDISLVERQPQEDESPTAVVGSQAYQALTHSAPETKETRETLSNLVHWGYGILQGALYGAARAANGAGRGLDLRGGAIHALGLWLMGDEVTVPLLGLQQGPTAVSPVDHVNRLGAHLAYSLTTAATSQALRRLL